MQQHPDSRKLSFSGLLLILAAVMLPASPVTSAEFDQQHTIWNEVLGEYVVETEFASTVRYAALKKNPARLEQYLKQITAVSRKDYDSWTRDQKLSFLINAYNALTVKLVLDHYPVDSIKDIGSLFKSSWKIEFFTLLGEKMHLDHIEHGMIRTTGKFREPRIHFALVCASIFQLLLNRLPISLIESTG